MMNDECELAGVPKPEFEMSGGYFKATFQRNDYVADASAGEQQGSSRTQVGPKWDPSRPPAESKFFTYSRISHHNAYRILHNFAAYGYMQEEKPQKIQRKSHTPGFAKWNDREEIS